MINRSAIVVRAKRPFLDWLRKLPEPVELDLTLDRINREPTVYLLPSYDDNHDREQLLTRFHDMIFEAELAEWWVNEADWPLVRDLYAFKEWFDVAFHSAIADLVDEPLVDKD